MHSVCASMSIMEFKPLLGLNSVVAIPRTLMPGLFPSNQPTYEPLRDAIPDSEFNRCLLQRWVGYLLVLPPDAHNLVCLKDDHLEHIPPANGKLYAISTLFFAVTAESLNSRNMLRERRLRWNDSADGVNTFGDYTLTDLRRRLE
ncbi:hypothetical protein EYR38_010622 [Pleurotus pulmonarius]|nr:hypothetical protein EYR38_010622 [Pleurotus pulmonarius]